MPKKPDLTDEDQAMRERLGAAIRIASAQKGLKPADLAAAAGVALSQQYRIENGELTADVLYLVKVAALLGMSVDALLQQAQAEVVLAPASPGAAPGPGVTQTLRGSRSVQIHGSKNKVSTNRD